MGITLNIGLSKPLTYFQMKEITGIILAGGKSLRMGSDKGMMLLKGKKFIEYIIEAIRPVTNRIIIIANNENYNYLGYPIYKDIIKDCGPMGGIYTGLTYSETEKNLVVSCDIPFISEELLNYIIRNGDDCEIAIPEHDGKIEPLCALYSKNCTTKFKGLIEKNKFKMKEAIDYFKVKKLPLSKEQSFYSEELFFNINTLLELEKLENKDE